MMAILNPEQQVLWDAQMDIGDVVMRLDRVALRLRGTAAAIHVGYAQDFAQLAKEALERGVNDAFRDRGLKPDRAETGTGSVHESPGAAEEQQSPKAPING